MRRLFLSACLLPISAFAAPVVLTDADMAVANQSYGELRRDLSLDGNTLQVGGRKFATGLGSHTTSEIVLSVPAGTARFTGAVGVDDEVGRGRGLVTFRILSGDTVLWESKPMKAGDAPAAFDIAAPSAKHRKLYLVADALGSQEYDHADWLDLNWVAGTSENSPAKIFSGEEFGFIPDSREDATPAMRRALVALRDAPGSTLRLAKGTYHFFETEALKRHFHISNHDQPEWHPVCVPLVDLRNITLDGQDSVFVFHGSPMPILIQDSEKVTVRGVAVDYAIPHLAQGVITATGPGWYEVNVDTAKFPHDIVNGWFTFRGKDWKGPAWTGGIVFEGKSGMIVPGTADYGFGGKLTVLSPGKYRVEKDVEKSGIKAGDVITLRQGPLARPQPGITLYRAKDTVLKNCPVYAAQGMGILAQRSENIRVTGGGIHPAPDSGRYFSTNADATHYSNCKGLLIEEDGLYAGMMDDAVNVHCTCLRVQEKIDARTIRCRYMHGQSVGFEIALPGENLRFIKAATLTDGETRRVTGIRKLNTEEVVFTFDAPLPADLVVGDALENPDWQPSVIFRGNTVKNNRARGALFTTNKPVLVENNSFLESSGSAILLAGDANGWFESGGCHDVLIRKNFFRDNLTSRYQFTDALIVACPEVPDLKSQTKRYHANVRIEDNTFETFDVPLVRATSVNGLAFTGNKVVYNTRYKAWGQPAFRFAGCEKIVIRDNTVENAPATAKWPAGAAE